MRGNRGSIRIRRRTAIANGPSSPYRNVRNVISGVLARFLTKQLPGSLKLFALGFGKQRNDKGSDQEYQGGDHKGPPDSQTF